MLKVIILLFIFCLEQKWCIAQIVRGKEVAKLNRLGQKSAVETSSELSFIVNIQILQQETSGIKRVKTNCAGIILELDVILTAAHCLRSPGFCIHEIEVSAGIKNLTNREVNIQKIKSKGYKLHEKYSKSSYSRNSNYYYAENDIAIIWLERKLVLNNSTQKAKFPKYNFNIEKIDGEVAGWGENGYGETTDNLKSATLRGISKSECQSYWEKVVITDKVFCAISVDEKSIVSTGDSGGPFIYNGIVLGLLSFRRTTNIFDIDSNTISEGNPRGLVVYTNLFIYKKWIKKSLQSKIPVLFESKCSKSSK